MTASRRRPRSRPNARCVAIFPALICLWPAVAWCGTPPLAQASEGTDSFNAGGVHNALGFVGGWHGASGMCYRHYFGANAVQLNFIAAVLPEEDSFVWAGLNYARIVALKRTRGRQIGWGLRAVAGASYRWESEVIYDYRWDLQTQSGKENTHTVTNHILLGGAGIGLQVGALDTPGISVALDVTATAQFHGSEFQWLVPLPSLELLYHW